MSVLAYCLAVAVVSMWSGWMLRRHWELTTPRQLVDRVWFRRKIRKLAKSAASSFAKQWGLPEARVRRDYRRWLESELIDVRKKPTRRARRKRMDHRKQDPSAQAGNLGIEEGARVDRDGAAAHKAGTA